MIVFLASSIDFFPLRCLNLRLHVVKFEEYLS